jgi:hypothetical protein
LVPQRFDSIQQRFDILYCENCRQPLAIEPEPSGSQADFKALLVAAAMVVAAVVALVLFFAVECGAHPGSCS